MAAIRGEHHLHNRYPHQQPQQQKFALHSLNDEHKNKTFVFVKLTDSALKSIEDYMSLNSNLRKSIARPTIQFQSDSNQGAITLPLNNQQISNNKKEIKYSFNLSNVDADGPQGSFEFLRQQRRQGGRGDEECIESLGSMLIKMQIHASEDIYQKTKVKMANAELDAKKHSTKVIKETGPNVGRKIKKTIVGGLQNSSNNLNNLNTLSGNMQDNGILYKDSLIDNQDLSPKNSINNDNSNNSTTAVRNAINNSSNLNSIMNTNQTTTSNVNTTNITPANPDLIRRPIRDRLIHLLAMRPFKKPELLVKLNRDGGLLRDKDKKGLGALLNQITNLKDNSYHLTRGAWHEVQIDDWPFYTPEERELVRKRNPLTTSNANLSVNNSAIKDNNLTSNSISPLPATADNQQSPNMFPSSPSNKRTIDSSSSSSSNLMNNLNNNSNNNSNNNLMINSNNNNLDYDYATVNKKQRISHHKANNNSNNNSNNNDQQTLAAATKRKSPPLIDSNGGSSLFSNGTNGNSNRNGSQNNSKKLTTIYDDVINTWENKPDYYKPHSKTPEDNAQQSNGSLNRLTNGHTNSHNNNNNHHSSPELNAASVYSNGLLTNGGGKSTAVTAKKNGFDSNNYRNINGSANNTSSLVLDRYNKETSSSGSHYNHHHFNLTSNQTLSAVTAATNQQQQQSNSLCSTPNSSPDSGTGSNDGSLSASSSRSSHSMLLNGASTTATGANDDQPDYLSKYTEIISMEQLRKYKNDFNYEYEEYKTLHTLIDSNAAKFAALEQELRQAQEGTETWNRIMERIVREYEETKRDTAYLNARNRMQYLHNKLAHIKSCILNFTAQQQSQYRKVGGGGLSAGNNMNSMNRSGSNASNGCNSSRGRIYKKSYNFNNSATAATGNQ